MREGYFDMHAIASLLKLYLRELPSIVLTKDMWRGVPGEMSWERCPGRGVLGEVFEERRPLRRNRRGEEVSWEPPLGDFQSPRTRVLGGSNA